MSEDTPFPTPAIDPEVGRFILEVTQATQRFPSIENLRRPDARFVLEQVRAPWAAGGPRMHSVVDTGIETPRGEVRVRIHRPRAQSGGPALVYLHGGGWTYFSINTHDRLMREYAHRSGLAVIGVDYSLSPESRFPVALEQVVGVLDHLANEGAQSWRIDPAGIAVGGDSAGANLALATALKLRDRGDADRIRALLLNYGAFSDRISPEAERRFGGPENMLTAAEMRDYWNNYVRDDSDFSNPLVCPLLARLIGLPPSLLIVPECDVLAEQSLELADRLEQAGCAVDKHVYAGATHSFLEAVAIASVSNRALDDSASWLSKTLT